MGERIERLPIEKRHRYLAGIGFALVFNQRVPYLAQKRFKRRRALRGTQVAAVVVRFVGVGSVGFIYKIRRVFQTEDITNHIIRNIAVVDCGLKSPVDGIVARAVDDIDRFGYRAFERVDQDPVALQRVGQLNHQVFRKPYALYQIQRFFGVLLVIVVKSAIKIRIHNRKHSDGIRVHLPYHFEPVQKSLIGGIGAVEIGFRLAQPHIHAFDIEDIAQIIGSLTIDISVFGGVKRHIKP